MELGLYKGTPVYRLILKGGGTYDMTPDEIELFKQAYPEIDVESEVRKMVAWCYSHESQRKTRRGIKRFINGWLNRAKPSMSGASMSQREYVRTTSVQDQLSDTSWV